MEKITLRNGKTAVLRKKLHEGSYIAYYNGPEGESVFVVHDDEIKNKTAIPYIFLDIDSRGKKRGNGKNNIHK